MFGLLLVGRVPLLCGRYWDRTSDPFHVKEVRYRCANRPWVRELYNITNYRE